MGYFDLQNADPQDVYNNLQDLFQRNNVRAQNNNVNPSMGQNSPLYKRVKNNTQTTSARDDVWVRRKLLSKRRSRGGF